MGPDRLRQVKAREGKLGPDGFRQVKAREKKNACAQSLKTVRGASFRTKGWPPDVQSPNTRLPTPGSKTPRPRVPASRHRGIEEGRAPGWPQK